MTVMSTLDLIVGGRFKPRAVRDSSLITGAQRYPGAAAARLRVARRMSRRPSKPRKRGQDMTDRRQAAGRITVVTYDPQCSTNGRTVART
jgi:hypothetical protein